MKKFLVVLLMILAVSSIFASQEMQMELVNYWILNDIECIILEESIWMPITDNMNINVAIMKDYDSIYFMFDYNTTAEDYEEFLLESEKLPYSQEFRLDLAKTLMENMEYFVTFEKLPDPYYEWIGDYFVYIRFNVAEDFYYLAID